jgi:hypothetical protein
MGTQGRRDKWKYKLMDLEYVFGLLVPSQVQCDGQVAENIFEFIYLVFFLFFFLLFCESSTLSSHFFHCWIENV